MIELVFKNLIAWMPLPLATLCCGVISLFFLVAILRLISFILDLIPFL